MRRSASTNTTSGSGRADPRRSGARVRAALPLHVVLPPEAGGVLLRLARAAARAALGGPDVAIPDLPWLREPASCFVTVRLDGRLRGCVGSVDGLAPLGAEVADQARGATLHDRRFARMTPDELARAVIEVAVLSPTVPMPFRDKVDAVSRLRPYVDGVVVEAGGHRATFLPVVWRSLPDPLDFTHELLRKAGLDEHAWSTGFGLRRFVTADFIEVDRHAR